MNTQGTPVTNRRSFPHIVQYRVCNNTNNTKGFGFVLIIREPNMARLDIWTYSMSGSSEGSIVYKRAW